MKIARPPTGVDLDENELLRKANLLVFKAVYGHVSTKNRRAVQV